MNLLDELRKIENLSGKTRLKILCTEGITITGNYAGYVSALDNEPEVAQIDIDGDNGAYYGIEEAEIESIEVIN